MRKDMKRNKIITLLAIGILTLGSANAQNKIDGRWYVIEIQSGNYDAINLPAISVISNNVEKYQTIASGLSFGVKADYLMIGAKLELYSLPTFQISMKEKMASQKVSIFTRQYGYINDMIALYVGATVGVDFMQNTFKHNDNINSINRYGINIAAETGINFMFGDTYIGLYGAVGETEILNSDNINLPEPMKPTEDNFLKYKSFGITFGIYF
jgi:hypothetical protein